MLFNRGDEDEDEYDEYEDSEKVNEIDGVEVERLKVFNVSFFILCGYVLIILYLCCCLSVSVNILELCLFNF